ncbi:MAG: cytochrome and DOMON domain-containing protein [Gammaproteobacteria bacterium]|nr:cytochrome and DOMON domain-containing protein [Gammaproteobacteria bacterium]
MSRPVVAVLSCTALLLFSVRAAAVAGCPPGWSKTRPPASQLLICWQTDGNVLRVEMAHPGRVWLALGFGEGMAGADAIVGRPETGEVLDVSIAGISADSIAPDLRQDVSEASIAFDGARTALRFTRALDTGDAEDFAIAPGDKSPVIWAVGDAPGFSGHFARGVLRLDWKGGARFAWNAKIVFHVSLMLLAWGLLVPLGIVIARYYKVLPGQDFPRELDNQFWWNWHRILQYGGMLTATVALIPVLRAHRDGITDWHAAAGLAALGLGWLQALSGVLRGSKGGPVDDDGRPNPLEKIRGDHYDMTLRRRIFEPVHKAGGYLAALAGCAAIALGLLAVGAPWIAWLVFACWLCALAGWFAWLQKSGRWADTYIAIWGPDKRHPGNRAR